ncbi:MAG: peptidoglycan-binding protein [Kaiparowitsia implicata GSE-PSE-MK54-09C]|jgi:peptidoglycan hydrolase-like protein with peptidoglycan-binding domain|nr:peptidoglycan-binding protein [Kaiparowitsia implicata GSE-PSE-MK54-09C]
MPRRLLLIIIALISGGSVIDGLPVCGAVSQVAIATPAPDSPTESVPGLDLGSQDSRVIELQQILTDLGYYTEAIDGQFGSQTRTAVVQFQEAQGLTPTGVVESETWFSLLEAHRALSPAIALQRESPEPEPEPRPEWPENITAQPSDSLDSPTPAIAPDRFAQWLIGGLFLLAVISGLLYRQQFHTLFRKSDRGVGRSPSSSLGQSDAASAEQTMPHPAGATPNAASGASHSIPQSPDSLSAYPSDASAGYPPHLVTEASLGHSVDEPATHSMRDSALDSRHSREGQAGSEDTAAEQLSLWAEAASPHQPPAPPSDSAAVPMPEAAQASLPHRYESYDAHALGQSAGQTESPPPRHLSPRHNGDPTNGDPTNGDHHRGNGAAAFDPGALSEQAMAGGGPSAAVPLPPQTAMSAELAGTMRLPRHSVVDTLLDDLHHVDPTIRRQAIWELGQVADSRALQPLADRLLDVDSQQRSLMLAAIAEIGMRSLQPVTHALNLSLDDQSPEVRKNAIRDVTRVYDQMAQISQVLNHAIHDPDPEVQETARWAIARLHRSRSVLPNDANVSPPEQ